MKFAQHLFVLLIFLAVLMPSCKKGDNTTAEKTTSEYLTQKPWVLAVYRVDTGDGNWKQGNVTPCNVDDIYNFNTNNSFILNSGPQVCTLGDPTERRGEWSILENGRTININGTYFTGSYSVDQINDRKMVLVSLSFKQEFTFTHP